jgi:hypothetical protein
MNGIGLIDYRRKPDFKVGDWVRYRITGANSTGAKDDYKVTVLIAGEERFWGEDGFWVETWTQPKNGPPMGTVTLMSYAIFEDSLPIARMQLYQRKAINESDGNGVPIQVLLHRSPPSLRTRTPFDDKIAVDFDTLGPDTVTIPRGSFKVTKVRVRQGKSQTRDMGDSTDYTEVWDTRIDYMSRRIPITSVVRESIQTDVKQRRWQIGHSEDAPPMHYLDRSLGQAVLEDYGSGMKSNILLPSMQKSLPRGSSGTPPATAPKKSAAKKPG